MAIPTLARDFKEFLKSFNSNGVEYLLIGGYAVGIYGHQGHQRSRCLGQNKSGKRRQD